VGRGGRFHHRLKQAVAGEVVPGGVRRDSS
jgi:hypothetical protein